MLCVREGTEGPYTGNGGVLRRDTPHEVATEVSVNTAFGVERVARYAFERAVARPRKHLTLIHKTNVLTHAGSLWSRTVEEVAAEFPEVTVAYQHVDAASMFFVTDPSRYDVVVTDNLFGDIVTDIAAAVTGGIGLAASGNIDASGTHPSMFEPVHGSAPDIAGQGIADPTATVLSVGLLLDHLGRPEQARKVNAAVAFDLSTRDPRSSCAPPTSATAWPPSPAADARGAGPACQVPRRGATISGDVHVEHDHHHLARSHPPTARSPPVPREVFLCPHTPEEHPVNDTQVRPVVEVFDTTLRDGAQREGITYSVADKLAVARLLDSVGVSYIEGGWPGALPKDTEFFARARTELQLRHAVLVAFGATRKAGVRVEDDAQVRALLDSEARWSAWSPRATPARARRVAHHARGEPGDGRRHRRLPGRPRPAGVRRLRALLRRPRRRPRPRRRRPAGRLRRRRRGRRPVRHQRRHAALGHRPGGHRRPRRVSGQLGIHCQDDTGCAVANSLAAVEAGVTQVQGTANGYGERAGNANTFTLIGNLVTKMGLPVVPAECLPELSRVAHAVAELANLTPDDHQPFVGASAFAHKAGLHASAIKVSPELYNHLDPAVVGNDMRILVTEMAGRASVELKGRELGVDLTGQDAAVGRVVTAVKEREARGWSYEAADASFELLLRGELPGAPAPLFELESWRTTVEHRTDGQVVSEAVVKVGLPDGDGGTERVVAVGEGNGPVNALDNALRAALVGRWPQLADVALSDYKVRILGWTGGTSATTRVLVDTADKAGEWTTVGVHENVVEASWLALVDALTYAVVSR